MSNYKLRWREKRARQASRGPWLRLDRAVLEEDTQGYSLTITGFGLQPGPVPPEVVVGGVGVTGLQFSADRRKLIGYLERQPESQEVSVNLGPGQQGKCTLDIA